MSPKVKGNEIKNHQSEWSLKSCTKTNDICSVYLIWLVLHRTTTMSFCNVVYKAIYLFQGSMSNAHCPIKEKCNHSRLLDSKWTLLWTDETSYCYSHFYIWNLILPFISVIACNIPILIYWLQNKTGLFVLLIRFFYFAVKWIHVFR